MQSSLKKVTAALATQQEPHLYVSDAARLGFPPGEPPRFLETDLGTGFPLWFTKFESDGTSIYRQRGKGKAIALRVLKAPDPLLTELSRIVEQSEGVREGLVAQASKADLGPLLQALRFGLTDSLRFFYRGMHAKAVLDQLAEASEGEPAAAPRLALRRLDCWLDSWTPETGSSPVTILHHSIEFEAVKEIARIVREAIEPGTPKRK